jgi:hypothetical protein
MDDLFQRAVKHKLVPGLEIGKTGADLGFDELERGRERVDGLAGRGRW